MDGKKIHVKIDAMGTPTIEAEGFNGMGCTDATAPIERALSGGGPMERTYKPEWSQTDQGNDNQDQMYL